MRRLDSASIDLDESLQPFSRMKAVRFTTESVQGVQTSELSGAVLLTTVKLPGHSLAKGSRLDAKAATFLIKAAQESTLATAFSVAYLEPGDLHEEDAARRLAEAVAGRGTGLVGARQGRINVVASERGLVRVARTTLARVNTIDPLEVFTVFDGQEVEEGSVVAGVKVAPHVVSCDAIELAEQVTRAAGPVVRVLPYAGLEVGALIARPMSERDVDRFTRAARIKIEALNGTLDRVVMVSTHDPDQAERVVEEELTRFIQEKRVHLVLVGGVSSGDPLAPFFEALDRLGGAVLRRGVPAHPGSMIWLAELSGMSLLGLPQCGMFSTATAADLILPLLMTGEPVTVNDLAELGYGGLLAEATHVRFPHYAERMTVDEPSERNDTP